LTRSAFVATVAAGLLLSGCTWTARRRADDRLAGGDARTAAVEYRRLLDVPNPFEPRDRLLFRAATAQALVDLEGGDLSESRALLARLLAEHPDSPYRASAELVLRLLESFEAAQRVEDAERSAETARREAGRLRADERARHARIAELEAELEALRQENELLKAIDLDRPPDDTPR